MSCRSISPVKTSVAPPLMITWSSASRQSICRFPPTSSISTERRPRPVSAAATATAQAPVPQAAVSPEPRSQTRMRRRSAGAVPSSCTNSTFTRCGKSGWTSMRGPRVVTGASSVESTKITQCGLPIEMQVMRRSRPSMANEASIIRAGAAIGTCPASKIGGPMSTATDATRSRSSRRSTVFTPESVSTRIGLRRASP